MTNGVVHNLARGPCEYASYSSVLCWQGISNKVITPSIEFEAILSMCKSFCLCDLQNRGGNIVKPVKVKAG